MKSTFVKAAVLTTLVTQSAFALNAIPEGTHRGVGGWKGQDGKVGDYTVEMSVKDNVVASVYRYGEKEESFTFKAEFKPGGFFKVRMKDHVVGEGYCGDYQCHYNVVVGPFQMEETLTFWEGKVYRLGAKGENGRQVQWQEALEAK